MLMWLSSYVYWKVSADARGFLRFFLGVTASIDLHDDWTTPEVLFGPDLWACATKRPVSRVSMEEGANKEGSLEVYNSNVERPTRRRISSRSPGIVPP